MIEDHWGKPIHVDFTWACRDENHVATDSCLSIKIGDKRGLDAAYASFYEDDLPSLRGFAALLLRQMCLQERGAQDHGKVSTENVAWLLEEMDRLRASFPAAPTQDGEVGGR